MPAGFLVNNHDTGLAKARVYPSESQVNLNLYLSESRVLHLCQPEWAFSLPELYRGNEEHLEKISARIRGVQAVYWDRRRWDQPVVQNWWSSRQWSGLEKRSMGCSIASGTSLGTHGQIINRFDQRRAAADSRWSCWFDQWESRVFEGLGTPTSPHSRIILICAPGHGRTADWRIFIQFHKGKMKWTRIIFTTIWG